MRPHLRKPKAKKGAGQRPCENKPKAAPVLYCLSSKNNLHRKNCAVLLCGNSPGHVSFTVGYVFPEQRQCSGTSSASIRNSGKSHTCTCPQAHMDHPHTNSTRRNTGTGTRECTPQNERILSALEENPVRKQALETILYKSESSSSVLDRCPP